MARPGSSHRRQRLLDTADARRPRVAAGARSDAGSRIDPRGHQNRHLGLCLPGTPVGPRHGKCTRCRCSAKAASSWASASVGRGIEDQLRELGLPLPHRASGSLRYVTRSRHYAALRCQPAHPGRDGGPRIEAQALAAEIADTATFAGMPPEPGVEIGAASRTTSVLAAISSLRSMYRLSGTRSRRSCAHPIRPGRTSCRVLAGHPPG